MNTYSESIPLLPVPAPAAVHAHIGCLLRHLRLARRLLRLAQAATDLSHEHIRPPSQKAAANA
jgi:hypothetical protein